MRNFGKQDSMDSCYFWLSSLAVPAHCLMYMCLICTCILMSEISNNIIIIESRAFASISLTVQQLSVLIHPVYVLSEQFS